MFLNSSFMLSIFVLVRPYEVGYNHVDGKLLIFAVYANSGLKLKINHKKITIKLDIDV